MIKLNAVEAKKIVGGDSHMDYRWQSVVGTCHAYLVETDKYGNATKSNDAGLVNKRYCGH